MSELCENCNHSKSDHIYNEGACRPGFICDCAQYVGNRDETELEKMQAKLSAAEARIDKLREALGHAKGTITSVKLTSVEGSEKYEWCEEVLPVINKALELKEEK